MYGGGIEQDRDVPPGCLTYVSLIQADIQRPCQAESLTYVSLSRADIQRAVSG